MREKDCWRGWEWVVRYILRISTSLNFSTTFMRRSVSDSSAHSFLLPLLLTSRYYSASARPVHITPKKKKKI